MNKLVMRAGILITGAMLLLAGCSSAINVASNSAIGKGSGKGEVVTHSVESFEAAQFSKVNIQTEAMNIVITQNDQDEASVELLTDELIKDQITIDASIQGEVLEVNVSERGKSMKDNSGERTLLITLPTNEELALNVSNAFGSIKLEDLVLDEATLELNAGNIYTNKVIGHIDATVNAGELEILKAKSEHGILAHVDAGNIKVEYDGAPQQASYDLRAEVGTVKLTVDDVDYSLNKKNEIQGKLGSNGAVVQARVNVGNISVTVK